MPRIKDITGKVFGHLTAIQMAGRNRHDQILWKFLCGCGREKIILGSDVVRGKTRSCGCKNLLQPGQKFGRLTLLKNAGTIIDAKGRKKRVWLTQCECGSDPKEVLAGNLKRGGTKSCGCLQRELAAERAKTRMLKHGYASRDNPFAAKYKIWQHMMDRCYNENNPAYKNYGGRGIKVHQSWHSFEQYAEDIGKKPFPDWSHDRIDVDGDYEPDNVRWAPDIVQDLNRRKYRKLLEVLCSKLGISQELLFDMCIEVSLEIEQP